MSKIRLELSFGLVMFETRQLKKENLTKVNQQHPCIIFLACVTSYRE